MSEKRFVIDIYTLPTTIVDSETSEPYSSMRSVVGLLNELNDENKTLKKENEWLRKELKGLNKKYIAFSEATDKRLREMMR